MFLAGDIGGTKTLLALVEPEKSGSPGQRILTERFQRRFSSADYPSLDSIIAEFLASIPGQRPGIQAACFGVAGAIHEGKCRATNLPWSMDERELAKALGCDPARVKLLNDVEATAYGLLFLKPDEWVELNPGAVDSGEGNIAVVAAGTGLGESILYWDGKSHHPMASEGGHCSFAPQSELEVELWRYLRGKFSGHVSYERILSGQGFFDLFDFLAQTGRWPQSDAARQKLQEAAREGGTAARNAMVTRLALEAKDPLCLQAVGLFLSIYGAEAGNMALKCVARGGVFLAGGIAPKMVEAFSLGSFLEGFMAKGRFASMLRNTRVRLALNQEAGLLGAGHYAADHLATA